MKKLGQIHSDRERPMDAFSPDIEAELREEFVAESRESIMDAEAALLTLETDRENQEAVNTIFRTFHNIKSTSGMLGLKRISDLAHGAESYLVRIRDREIPRTGQMTDLLLHALDCMKELVLGIQETGCAEPESSFGRMEALLRKLENPQDAGLGEDAEGMPSRIPRLGDILVAEGVITRRELEQIVARQGKDPLGLSVLKSKAASLSDVVRALRIQKRLSATEEIGSSSSLRIRAERLDRVIDMVGDLVIAQSTLAQDRIVRLSRNESLQTKVQIIGRTLRELQDLTVSLRMVSFKSTFQKVEKLVRDLSYRSGKLVDFITSGDETEVDRNIVDVLRDPLFHMARNAVDHGIEPPVIRQQRGKQAAGTVRLNAYHSGGSVVVELEDDGNGLDQDRIVRKATALGMIPAGARLSDGEVWSLILRPGFSTSEQVTDISGRGMGMDVVHRGIEALHGHIEIRSRDGNGCRFQIRVPLTTSRYLGLVMRVGRERYIMAKKFIQSYTQPAAASVPDLASEDPSVWIARDRLPLCRLDRLFGNGLSDEEASNPALVIVADGSRKYAVLVDEVFGYQRIVTRSLDSGLGGIRGVIASAILEDGRMGLVLDPAEVYSILTASELNRAESK